MINYTLIVNTEGIDRKFDLVINKASDIDGPMRRMGAHLKQKALAKYKAQAFQPLAASTLKERAQKGLSRMESKLQKDVGKAYKRQNGGVQMQKGFLASALAAIAGEPGGALLGGQSRGVTNRLAVLSEFQRRHRKGSSVLMTYSGKPLSIKQLSSLDARTERSVSKAVGKAILGRLGDSLQVTVGFGNVKLESRTSGTWSAVHNDGGEAGHGAKIPKRETLKLDEEDMRVLEELLKEHLLEPLVA